MRALLVSLWLLSGSTQAELLALNNAELGQVSAQDGVAIGLDWRLNADANGTPLTLCTDPASYRECRIAWSFNNRGTDDVDKKWLVLKGFSGALKIPYLSLDASTVTYTTDGGSSKTIPAALLGFGDANTKIQVKNLMIDNIAFEQDNATRRGYEADASTEPTGAAIPANVNTGFMALQISGPSNIANVRIEGTVKLFSCLGDHPSC